MLPPLRDLLEGFWLSPLPASVLCLLPLLTWWFYQDSFKNCWNACSVWIVLLSSTSELVIDILLFKLQLKDWFAVHQNPHLLQQRDGFYWLHQKLLSSLLHELCHTNPVSNDWMCHCLTPIYRREWRFFDVCLPSIRLRNKSSNVGPTS